MTTYHNRLAHRSMVSSQAGPDANNTPTSKKSGHSVAESPRRRVLNPFRKVDPGREPCRGKQVQSAEELIGKVTANPKTVKQRQQNFEALKAFNKYHEDDLFGGIVGPSTKTLLKPSLVEEDSDSEQDISVHIARTPLAAYQKKSGVKSTTPLLNYDRTPPSLLSPDSPLVFAAGFQVQAYIHKKVAQKTKDMRKKSKSATALADIVSRMQSQRMVDESSQIISRLTNPSSACNADEEEEGPDEWFEEPKKLSCDPRAVLMGMLSEYPV